jgi:hypothetical protein
MIATEATEVTEVTEVPVGTVKHVKQFFTTNLFIKINYLKITEDNDSQFFLYTGTYLSKLRPMSVKNLEIYLLNLTQLYYL